MSKSQKELYEFSRFRLDVSERLLQRDGKRVPITDKAFDTLCVLVRRSGELVGKDLLMNEVWADAIVEENNLDQKISMLRQALGERKGKEKFIETVRGHGYRFLPEVHRVETELTTNDLASEQIDPETAVADDKVSGSQSDNEGTAPQSSPRSTSAIKWAVPAVIGIAIVVVVAIFIFENQTQADNAPIESIAVLPFVNAAQDPNAEYLSDGLTESLINRLLSLSNLKVMSWGSVFQYKVEVQDPQKAGKELNVQAVLTGSVKQLGDQLVINVSLDDTKSGRHVWGEQYVRRFADVLAVQNDIAQDVSRNLRIKLTKTDEQRIAKRYTDNVEAYNFYAKGMYEWNKHTQQDLEKGIKYFDQALEQDPNYALAYSGLADSYGVLGGSYLPPREAFPKAKEYAAKALALDNDLADAHASMGAITLFYDWDFAKANEELTQALTIDPNNVGAHHIRGDYLEISGRFDEAIAERKLSLEIDPRSPLRNMVSGATYYFARRTDEAVTQLEKTVELEPRFYPAYFWLGQAYEQKKLPAKAIATYEDGISRSERNPMLVAALGHAYAVLGQREKAKEVLDELANLSKNSYVNPYFFAIVYAGLGDLDQTFAWFEKAFQDRSNYLLWLNVEPLFDPIRDDPRFRELLVRVGLEQ